MVRHLSLARRPSQSLATNVVEWIKIDDLFARLLTVICVMNLNGVVNLLTGRGQTFSILMLACCAYLLLRFFKRIWSPSALLVSLSIFSYLALAWVYYSPITSTVDPLRLTNSYFNSVIVLMALIVYCSGLRGKRRLNFSRFLRDVCIISAVATMASPFLYRFYVNLPPSFEQRMGGLFANPNEAATMGVLALALLQVFPHKRRSIQLCLILLIGASIIVTLSKTGMAAAVIVLTLTTFAIVKGVGKVALLSAVAAAVFVIQDLDKLIVRAVDMLGADLSASQMDRLFAVVDILSGRIDTYTSTNRSDIWALILSDAWDRFPAGGGLGSAHFYVGGYMDNGVWQGAHNTFLMVLAEAGPIPFALLVMTIGFTAWRVVRFGRAGFPYLVVLIVICIEMLASHNSLVLRQSNIALAFVVGMAASKIQERTQTSHSSSTGHLRANRPGPMEARLIEKAEP